MQEPFVVTFVRGCPDDNIMRWVQAVEQILKWLKVDYSMSVKTSDDVMEFEFHARSEPQVTNLKRFNIDLSPGSLKGVVREAAKITQ